MNITNGVSSSAGMTSCFSTLSRANVSEEFVSRIAEMNKRVAEDARQKEAFERGEIRADNDPENAFMNVMKDGEIVATIYKTGIVTIFEPFAGQLASLDLPHENSSQLELGKIRATMIAEAVGGEIQDIDSVSSRSPGQDEFLNRVQGWSNADAESYLTYQTSHPSVPLFDLTDAFNGGKIRLMTGQEFDSYADVQAYETEFEKVATKVMEGKRELYEAEKAKGTDPKKIIEMFVDYDNSQSTFYRAGTGAGFGRDGDHRDYVLNPVLKESNSDSLTALNSGEKLIELLEKTNSYNQNRLMEVSNKTNSA